MDNPALEIEEGINMDSSNSNMEKNPDLNNSSSEVSVSRSASDTVDISLTKNSTSALYYSIEDEPPWYLTAFLGFQHYITMAGSTVSVPFILCPAMCMAEDDPARAEIISTIIFVSGIVTLIQCTFGTRLPIIQGGSFSFIVPALAILGLPEWRCPDQRFMNFMTPEERTEIWQIRMREIQGAIIVASIFEVLFGLCGVVGVVLKYITPLTIAPAIALIGLSLFKVSATHAASNWGISILTILLIILFSQYLRTIKVPVPFTKSAKRNGRMIRYPLFEVFPVLLSIGIVWGICGVLTATGGLSEKNPARTDFKLAIIEQSSWFRVPYPFQWGMPTITAGAVFGMLSGVIASIVESMGDYFACARIAGAPPPPKHALNRGIFVEGIGCVLAGIFGTGNGTTSYSENIGAISVTKVGSRRVIQAAGVLMIIFSLIGKFGAIFISIPEPIIGGIFCVVFATVTAVGLSNLQGVDLNSSRNIFVIGFSIFFGLCISQWMADNKTAIRTGVESIDQILTILLSTGMFVSGFLGFILDNTIPGTPEERGLIAWSAHLNLTGHVPSAANVNSCYDLPFGMNLIRRISWLRSLPISPTFNGFRTPKLPTSSVPKIGRNKNKISISEGESTKSQNYVSKDRLKVYDAE